MTSEITVEVLCPKRKLFQILEEKGFFFKECLSFVDYYYTALPLSRTLDFKELMQKSMLIRNVKLERRYFSSDGVSTLMYKKKEIDSNECVISEEKIACELDSVNKAKKIFTAIGLKNWCTKKMKGHVFKRGGVELLIQEVEDLGLFIELEQFENQKGTGTRILNTLIKYIKELEIPIGNDFHVNIAYRIYIKNYLLPKPKRKKTSAKNSQYAIENLTPVVPVTLPIKEKKPFAWLVKNQQDAR